MAAAAPPRRRDSPPALPFELIEEILLLLPPDDPACLLRASLVCKAWGCAVSSPGFRRRLHELHRTPPMLGFLHNRDTEKIPRFIPTTASSFSLAAPDRRSWWALDCRHGRALFLSEEGQDTRELLLWEPITGVQQRILVPKEFECGHSHAAVVCAADGCDHRDCHGGPFLVVFLFNDFIDEDADDTDVTFTSACVYSSETGMWGELTWMDGEVGDLCFTFYSSLLVGTSLLYFLSDGGTIHEYDLAMHSLNMLNTPYCRRSCLMLAENGGLGVIQEFYPQQLQLWSREEIDGTDVRWVLSRVISLENLLPTVALVEGSVHVLLGFAEGANVVFVTTLAGLFTIELESQRTKKVCDHHGFCNLIPVVSFYTPHSRIEAPPVRPPLHLSPTEEVGGEEEKTLEQQTQELFGKCNAMEEENFDNSSDCFNHTRKTMVPHPGELTLDCARTFHGYGNTLLCKALEATDPAGNVAKNAPYEESVNITATASEDDPGSSEASRDKHVDSEKAGQTEPEDIDPDVAAMMDFEGFGKSK